MQWFRPFVLVAALLLLTACGASETPTPEPEQAPEQTEQKPAEQAEQQAPAQQPQMTRMQPCKVQNVQDDACTTELAKALTDILQSQGESDTAAQQAGQAISSAIKNAPVDKRNGFTMTGPDTGKRYSFLFQNEAGEAYLVLFKKVEGGGENEYEMITGRPMPSCECMP